MRTTTFGKLKENDLFVIVEDPEEKNVYEPWGSAEIFRKQKNPGHAVDPEAPEFVAIPITGLRGCTDEIRNIEYSVNVVAISQSLLHILSAFSAYQTQIGPPPLKRPEDFFQPGQSVWILKRDSKYLRWLSATIKTVEKVPSRLSEGQYNGPFIHLVEDIGINPGANGAIRFDDGDIWPRDETINP